MAFQVLHNCQFQKKIQKRFFIIVIHVLIFNYRTFLQFSPSTSKNALLITNVVFVHFPSISRCSLSLLKSLHDLSPCKPKKPRTIFLGLPKAQDPVLSHWNFRNPKQDNSRCQGVDEREEKKNFDVHSKKKKSTHGKLNLSKA
ncbi:hypothetical protein AMTRI_Chr10g229490 [Amborella trichopoda]